MAKGNDVELRQNIELEIDNTDLQSPARRENLYGGFKQLAKHIRHNYPNREVWMVKRSLGNNYYDIGSTDGSEEMSRVLCIDPKEAVGIEVGKAVVVGFENADRQKPYIKYGMSQGPSAVDLTPVITVPPVIVTFTAEMWIQAGAFWWSPYSSLVACMPFDFGETNTNEIEDFPTNGLINPIGDDSPFAGVFLELTLLPDNAQLTNLSLVTVDDSTFTDEHILIGDILYLKNVDHGAMHIHVEYTYRIIAGTPLNSATTGPSTAISLRGLNMFKEHLTGHQKVAILTMNYVPRDSDFVVTAITEDVAVSGTPQFAVTASHTPITDTLSGTSSGLVGSGVQYKLINQGDSIYGAALRDSSLADKITITYNYHSGDSTAKTMNFIAGQSQEFNESVTADSTNQTYTMLHPPVSFIVFAAVNGTSDPGVTNDDDTITFSVPVAPGDDLAFDYFGHSPDTNFDVGETIYTLIAAEVSGVRDLLATFTGSVVTLSVAAFDGDEVVIKYTVEAPVITVAEDFTLSPTDYIYTLAHIPIPNTISVPPLLDPMTSGSSFDGGTLGATWPLFQIIDEKKVIFAYKFPSGSTQHLSYNYNRADGELFDIDKITIKEWDLPDNTQVELDIPLINVFDATPDIQFSRDLLETSSKKWKDGWKGQWWGYLFYDPSVDAYAIIGPQGIYWRSRNTTAVKNVDYTFCQWPDEAISLDYIFVGFKYPADELHRSGFAKGLCPSPIKRRTAPYMGCSSAAGYVLQGSWGSVGPNKIKIAQPTSGGGQGVASDTDFPIRFFQRDEKNNTYSLVNELSVTKLTEAGTKFPVYIPSTGIIHQEGIGGYAAGRLLQQPLNSWWPATKDATTWMVGCGWCTADWLKDISANNTQEHFTQLKTGLDDSGYTLNMISPTGHILSQTTIKCSPTYEENLYDQENLTADNDYIIAHSGDFLTTPQTSYHGLTGQPPKLVIPFTQTLEASEGFGWRGGSGYSWFAYTMTTTDGDAKRQNMLMPGIPALADGLPRFSNGVYGTIQPNFAFSSYEDTPTSQNITGDSEGNFYFALSIPYWCRTMDTVKLINSEKVRGSYTVGNLGPVLGNGHIDYTVTGYLGGGTITRIMDKTQIASDAPYFPNSNKTYIRTSPAAGFSLPSTTPVEHQVTYITPIVDHIDTSDPDHPIPVYKEQNFPNYIVEWEQIIPIRTASETHFLTGSGLNGWVVGTNGGEFIEGHMGADFPDENKALTVYDVIGDNRRQYTQKARTFLYKYKSLNGSLEKLWEKDISQVYNSHNDHHVNDGSTVDQIAVSEFSLVHHVKACGRYIFLVRQRYIDVATGNPAQPITPGLVLCFEAWENTDSEPTMKHRQFIPGVIEPTPAADYHGVGQNPFMVCGIDDSEHEWIFITTDKPDNTPERFLLKFKDDINAAPDVTDNLETIADLCPTTWNTQGMTAANDIFMWSRDDNSVMARQG